MLHIMLLVLKIIGIILAIITVLCAVILLIPFSYVGKGDFKEKARATFVSRGFLSIVYFKMSLLNSDVKYVFRVFGIPVLRGTIGDSDSKEGINTSDNAKNKNKVNPDKYAGIMTIEETADGTEHEEGSDASPKDILVGERIKKYLVKIKNIPTYFSDIKLKYRKLKRFLKSEKTKIAYYYTKDIIQKIYHHVKPGKVEANIVFGFDSPDKTGKALAVLGVIYGTIKINQEKFQVIPDFQEKKLEGTAYMKGHFVLGYVLVQIFKLYFKKEVHDIIESFSK